jgi:hypothetical protein
LLVTGAAIAPSIAAGCVAVAESIRINPVRDRLRAFFYESLCIGASFDCQENGIEPIGILVVEVFRHDPEAAGLDENLSQEMA